MLIDAKLVEDAKRGDPVAFTNLYNLTYKSAYGICYQLVKNADDACDILQDSYITAFTKLNTLEEPEKFQGWFNRIVANNCKNFLKKKKPTLFSELTIYDEDGDEIEPEFEDLSGEFRPDEKLDYEERKKIIREIVELLPEDQRMCILMFYVQDMTIPEIAELLSISPNTVKSRLSYGRKKMKAELEERKKKGAIVYGFSGVAIIPFLRWMFADGVVSEIPNVLPQTLATVNKTCASVASTTNVSSETTKTKSQNKKIKKSQGIKAIAKTSLAVTASVAVGMGAIAVSNADSVNIEKYFEEVVYCEGYDGYGVLSDFESVIDIEKLEKKLCGDSENLEKYQSYCSLNHKDIMDFIEIIPSENSYLSNGDEIALQIKIDYDKINNIDGVEKDLKGDEEYSITCKIEGLTDSNAVNVFSIIKSVSIDTTQRSKSVMLEFINDDNKIDFGHCVVSWYKQSYNRVRCTVSYFDSVTGTPKIEYFDMNFDIPATEECVSGNTFRASLSTTKQLGGAGFVFSPTEYDFEIKHVLKMFGNDIGDNINEESYNLMIEKTLAKAEFRFGQNIRLEKSVILQIKGYNPCVGIFFYNEADKKYYLYEYEQFLIDENYTVYGLDKLEPTLYEVWQKGAGVQTVTLVKKNIQTKEEFVVDIVKST